MESGVTSPITVTEIDHVVLRCRDQARMLRFYIEVLGLVEERRLEAIGLVQLRAGRSLVDFVPGTPAGYEGANVDHVCLMLAPVEMEAVSRWLAEHLRTLPTGHAELVVLTIGTNDGRVGKFTGLEDRYRLISSRIQAPILWNAIPPSAGYDVGPTNALVRKVCSERPDCRYLETPFEYPGDLADDGHHLSLAGYERWIAALRAAIAEARAQRPRH